MIGKVLDFCIRERLVMLIALIAVFAFGWYSTKKVPLDAIPNVGENQVIVLSEWMGRSPKDVEDQITYPLSIALQAVPGSKSVRGKSMFGFSFVQVTFGDEVDFYWARSRVAEQLTTVGGSLPEGVTPALAPDATALGQIYYYVLEPPAGMDLAEQRSRQDFFIKYSLQSVDGVAEVASIGGYVRQYQIEVDPDQLRYHDVTLGQIIECRQGVEHRRGCQNGRNEWDGVYRPRQGVHRLRQDGAGDDPTRSRTRSCSRVDGVPVRVRDLAQVQTGPAFRRGALDFNGQEAVGGVVVMRYGENPRDVIERVKAKVASLESELDGITIHGVYDRTLLIDETVTTLSDALFHETLITIAVMVLFLLHVRASIVIAVTLPMAVLMAFIAMKVFGVDANIMSLAGIAIAIGTMVDMGIIILENIYGGLADWEVAGSPGGLEQRVRGDSRIGSGSRPGRVDRGQHDDRQLPAGVLPDGPRPSAVCTAGVDQDLCPGLQPDRGGDDCADALSGIPQQSSKSSRWSAVAAALGFRHAECRFVPVRLGPAPRDVDLAEADRGRRSPAQWWVLPLGGG